MYHCNLIIYYIGRKTEYEILKDVEPLDRFTHMFLYSDEPKQDTLKGADVILADISDRDAEGFLSELRGSVSEKAQIILLADKSQEEKLMQSDLSIIEDIWYLPLSESALKFFFSRWQRSYKEIQDHWLTDNYLETMINSVPQMIWYKDNKGAHIKVNDFFCQTVGKTKEQIAGRGHYYIWDIEPDEYAKGEYICMESEYEVMNSGETCVFDEKVKIGSEMRQLKTYKSPLFDLDGSVMGTVGVALDVTEEQMYEKMLVETASTDALTGLYNRRYAYEYLSGLKGNPITVYALDLDNFKSINDIYGHQEGDRALVLTADTLKACASKELLVRNGGDEFMIVTLGQKTAEEVESFRSMLEEELDHTFIEDENLKIISASVGAAYISAADNFDKLFAEADARMYSEKRRKKYRVRSGR